MDDYQQELKRIEREVGSLSSTSSVKQSSSGSLSESSLYIKYAGVIIGLFIFLFLIRPGFILGIKENGDGKLRLVVNKFKFIMWWIILSILCCSILYLYNKRS